MKVRDSPATCPRVPRRLSRPWTQRPSRLGDWFRPSAGGPGCLNRTWGAGETPPLAACHVHRLPRCQDQKLRPRPDTRDDSGFPGGPLGPRAFRGGSESARVPRALAPSAVAPRGSSEGGHVPRTLLWGSTEVPAPASLGTGLAGSFPRPIPPGGAGSLVGRAAEEEGGGRRQSPSGSAGCGEGSRRNGHRPRRGRGPNLRSPAPPPSAPWGPRVQGRGRLSSGVTSATTRRISPETRFGRPPRLLRR